METVPNFISTVDHLPCDIIRSIWLIQSCNIVVDIQKKRLDEILQSIQNGASKEEYTKEIVNIRQIITRHSMESISEARALKNQLVSHQSYLDDEVLQLRSMSELKKSVIESEESSKKLRQQLKEHYEVHPLVSQREAVRDKEKVVKNGSGLKIILKIPKQRKESINIEELKNEDKETPVLAKEAPVLVKEVVLPKKSHKKKEVLVEPAVEKVEEKEEKPKEELYCFCRQPSFGDMIACDNRNCPNEWFHYKCVKMSKATPLTTRWFCSDTCKNEYSIKRKKKRRW